MVVVMPLLSIELKLCSDSDLITCDADKREGKKKIASLAVNLESITVTDYSAARLMI